MQSARGLTWEVIPGVQMPIPDTIEVLRCATCDNHLMDGAKVREIEEALDPARREWLRAEAARAIEILRQRDDVTIGQLEGALGVARTHLSHSARDATKAPSLPLVRLLQAFVAHSAELCRHLERRPFPAIDLAIREWFHVNIANDSTYNGAVVPADAGAHVSRDASASMPTTTPASAYVADEKRDAVEPSTATRAEGQDEPEPYLTAA